MSSSPRIVEVRQNVLKHNDEIACGLRGRFQKAGVFVVSLVSSPAALVGDLATDNDAARLARSHAPVKQITTGTICHLEAAMIAKAVDEWPFDEHDFLFIENAGNLVCPSSYDLGENLRLVLLSVTEGEDKPLKYPTIFNSSDVAIVTKLDLAEAVEFDWAAAHGNVDRVRPGMPVIRVSAKTGRGMDEWLDFLQAAST